MIMNYCQMKSNLPLESKICGNILENPAQLSLLDTLYSLGKIDVAQTNGH